MAPAVKVRDAIREIESDGWYLVAIRGDHRQYRHPLKPGKVTVAGHLGKDLPPGLYESIRKQAGLKGRR